MARRKYTEEHIEYIREISPGRYNDEITEMFNKRFGMKVTSTAINSLKTRYGIKSNVSPSRREYTNEQLDYLRKLGNEGLFNREMTKKFNEKFGTDKTERAIKSIRQKHNIRTNARNHFPKGHTPWNKGMKGLSIGGEETQFKKGNTPYNHMPVGTERINSDGYADIKIAEPNVWLPVHRFLWEREHGPIPDGHVVIFGDGDKTNLSLDNLILVSRKQLLGLNQRGLIKNHADLTRTAVKIVDLDWKIKEVNKNGR